MIKRIARFKIYIDRARWYYVLIQFYMISVVFLNSLDLDISWYYYLIFIVIMTLGMIFVGWFDRYLGIIKEEQRFYSTENPVIQEILNRIKEDL